MKFLPDALEHHGYRLPTEAEMEYFCRANTSTSRPFGETEELLPKFAWTWLNSGDRLHPVGMLLPNELGLFDVLGNAYEWCHDGRDERTVGALTPYPEASIDHPANDEDDRRRDSRRRHLALPAGWCILLRSSLVTVGGALQRLRDDESPLYRISGCPDAS